MEAGVPTDTNKPTTYATTGQNAQEVFAVPGGSTAGGKGIGKGVLLTLLVVTIVAAVALFMYNGSISQGGITSEMAKYLGARPFSVQAWANATAAMGGYVNKSAEFTAAYRGNATVYLDSVLTGKTEMTMPISIRYEKSGNDTRTDFSVLNIPLFGSIQMSTIVLSGKTYVCSVPSGQYGIDNSTGYCQLENKTGALLDTGIANETALSREVFSVLNNTVGFYNTSTTQVQYDGQPCLMLDTGITVGNLSEMVSKLNALELQYNLTGMTSQQSTNLSGMMASAKGQMKVCYSEKYSLPIMVSTPVMEMTLHNATVGNTSIGIGLQLYATALSNSANRTYVSTLPEPILNASAVNATIASLQAPFLGTTCITTPGYGCNNVSISKYGKLSFLFGQNTNVEEYNVGFACTANSTMEGAPYSGNNDPWEFPTAYTGNVTGRLDYNVSYTALPGGELLVHNLTCYNSNGTEYTPSKDGQTFVGKIWLNYTVASGNPATRIGNGSWLTDSIGVVSATVGENESNYTSVSPSPGQYGLNQSGSSNFNYTTAYYGNVSLTCTGGRGFSCENATYDNYTYALSVWINQNAGPVMYNVTAFFVPLSAHLNGSMLFANNDSMAYQFPSAIAFYNMSPANPTQFYFYDSQFSPGYVWLQYDTGQYERIATIS